MSKRNLLSAIAMVCLVILCVLIARPIGGEEHSLQEVARLTRQIAETHNSAPLVALKDCRLALDILNRISTESPHYKNILQSRILSEMCWIYKNIGEFRKAVTCGQKSIALAEKENAPQEMAIAYKHIGTAYSCLSENKTALEYYNRALTLFKRTRNKTELANTLNNIGTVYDELGMLEKTVEYYQQALKTYQEMGDHDGIATALSNIGCIYLDLEKYQEALNYFNKSLDIYRQCDNLDGGADNFNNIGIIYCNLKNYSRSLDAYNKALEIYTRLHDKWSIALVLDNIAELYIDQLDYPAALSYTQQSLELWQITGYRWGIANNLKNMAIIYRNTGKLEQALVSANQSLTIAKKISADDILAKLYETLSLIYYDLKDYKSALLYHRQFITIDDELYRQTESRKTTELQIRYRTEQTSKELEILEIDKKIEQMEITKERHIQISLQAISILVFILVMVLYNRYQVKLRGEKKLKKEIAEHKQTLLLLLENEEKFRTLAEKSVVGIYILQDNTFKYVNPRFCAIFEYPPEQLIGSKNLSDLVDKQDWDGYGEYPGLQLQRIEHANSHHFKGIKQNGDIVHLESYISRIIYEDREAALGTVIDITERINAEEEILKSSKLESLGILAGGIAHDFNNLLVTINSNLNLLRLKYTRGRKAPDTGEIFKNWEEASSRVVDLAQRLITFCEGGWLMRERVELFPLIQTVIESFPILRERHYQVNIPPQLPAMFADERQCRQVIHNLLVNAVEADRAHHTICIDAVAVTHDEGSTTMLPLPPGIYIKLSIRDRGAGIAPEHMEKLFEPYFSTKNDNGHMGLGLSICYSIIKKHDGWINIDSQPNNGTCVDVYIPAYNSTQPDFSTVFPRRDP